MSSRVTQREVSRRAGVGQMTVSRVLSGVGYVSEATRERVLEAARELGYKTSAPARAMRTGRTGVVALLQDTATSLSTLPPMLLRGIHGVLVERGLHLLIERVPDEDVLRTGEVPRVLRMWMADGVLVNHNPDLPRDMVRLVRQNDIPAVFVNSKQSSDCVRPDDKGAARRATEALLELGHRRIAFVDYTNGASTTPAHYSSVDRREGYLAAMESARLRPRVIQGSDYIPRRERVAFTRAWLDRKNRPTAVVAPALTVAEPVLVAAMASGLGVPSDISVVSIDNHQSELTGIALATMVIPWSEIGRSAVEMLVEKIERPQGRLKPRTIGMNWLEGESIGRPPTMP